MQERFPCCCGDEFGLGYGVDCRSFKEFNPVKAPEKEIYGSRQATSSASNGNGDKLDESLQSVFELELKSHGPERTAQLLEKLADQLRTSRRPAAGLTMPYVNTIRPDDQAPFPGDRRRIPRPTSADTSRPSRRPRHFTR
jgi:hypothetical protein